MIIKNTQNYRPNGVKILVHGEAGAGKTPLILTLSNVFVFASDPGLLSIKGYNIPYVSIDTYKDFILSYDWIIRSPEAKKYDTYCIDSISEHAKLIFSHYEQKNKDVRRAYQLYMKDLYAFLRHCIKIAPQNIFCTGRSTKIDKIVDETKPVTPNNTESYYSPSMPSEKTREEILYLFDEIFALREAVTIDGYKYKYLQTRNTSTHFARDRSMFLDPIEEPNLQKIINKIKGVKT